MPWPRSSTARSLLLAAFLTLALVAAYWPSLHGGFLWDDDLHITANPTIVGPLGLTEIWTTARANYFPLVLTNFWLQHALWGVDPIGYRIVTLAFHIGAALLLWRVLCQLRVPAAWAGAALWALHPVQTESVAWICELKNTQSAVFFLAAIGSFVCWLEARETLPAGARRWYAVSLCCALLAILSKPSTVMLPVALLLCAAWVRRRLVWRDVFSLVPFFALSTVAAGWTIWEQKFHSGAVGAEWSQTPLERLAIAGRAIWFYLGKLLWPEPLIFIYPRWQIDVRQPLAFLGFALAVATAIGLWRKRDVAFVRSVGFSTGYFVALLFPVLGFFSVYFFRYSFVGDHFQYLASMGIAALLAATIHTCLGSFGRPLLVSGLLALGLMTAQQSRVYRDNEGLWRDTLAHNPHAIMAWLNLGDTLTQARRYDEAIATFRHALSLRPNDPYGLNDLANVLVIVGRPAEAVPYFERALELKPEFPDALSNFGNALRLLGRSGEAIAHFERALALQPEHTDALNNLGVELAEAGRATEAIPLLERAVRRKPSDAALHDNLAGALRAASRFDEAMTQHRAALRLKPDFAEGHANFGRTFVAAGKPAEALPEFERALQLKPTSVAARSNYARALAALGRMDDALAQLERAVELSPDSGEAHLNLGTALAQSGRVADAIAHFEKAAAMGPNAAAAHANLGMAFASEKRWARAIEHFAAAAKLQPDLASAHTQLAVALVNDGQLAAAVPEFEAALRLTPEAADLHDNFGQVLNALGRKREAFDHLEEAARLRRARAR